MENLILVPLLLCLVACGVVLWKLCRGPRAGDAQDDSGTTVQPKSGPGPWRPK